MIALRLPGYACRCEHACVCLPVCVCMPVWLAEGTEGQNAKGQVCSRTGCSTECPPGLSKDDQCKYIE